MNGLRGGIEDMDISEKTIRQAWEEALPPAAPLKVGAEDFESIDLPNSIRQRCQATLTVSRMPRPLPAFSKSDRLG